MRMDLVSAARVLRERREEGSRRRRCDGSSGYVVKIRADRIRFRALPARLMTTIRPSRFPNSEKARRLRRRMRIVYQAKPDNAGEQFSIGEAGARCGAGVRAQFRSERKCPVGISAERGLFEHGAPTPHLAPDDPQLAQDDPQSA